MWDWLKGLVGGVIDFFTPWFQEFVTTIFTKGEQVLYEKIMPGVLGILADINNDPNIILDDDRRHAAFTRIESLLTTDYKVAAIRLGVTVTTSFINRLIENALEHAKKTGQLPPNAGE
ncbi:hypothetical protein C4571_01920 [Candidatus Parcubacteria bacterium]|nr:MAG: hypothetical protein C4571_01920 [Candidatus Parcubacteria bacterium]